MKQTWEYSKNLNLGPILARSAQIWAHIQFVLWVLILLVVTQFPGKLINQTWENGEKPNSGPKCSLRWTTKLDLKKMLKTHFLNALF